MYTFAIFEFWFLIPVYIYLLFKWSDTNEAEPIYVHKFIIWQKENEQISM